MSRRAGCGGILGRDCWNESDCVWIAADMSQRGQQQEPEPCQGCSEITSAMRSCIGACDGIACEADLVLRTDMWAALIKARHIT